MAGFAGFGWVLVGCRWVLAGYRWVLLGFFLGCRRLQPVGLGCVAGGAWNKAPARMTACPRAVRRGGLREIFLWSDATESLDAGEGAPQSGEQVERERIRGGAGSVGAGCGLLSGSSHEVRLDPIVAGI